MTPSPRKRATTRFTTAWTDTDTASLDPASLPVSKLPRAWDRKPQTTVSSDGKAKTIWRRYKTRSSTENSIKDEDEDGDGEKEHDSGLRPVKKLQRVKPADMEHASVIRTFKTTRWDRRQSTLPRKKSSSRDRVDDEAGELDPDERDEESNNRVARDNNTDTAQDPEEESAAVPIPELEEAEAISTPVRSPRVETDQVSVQRDTTDPHKLIVDKTEATQNMTPPADREDEFIQRGVEFADFHIVVANTEEDGAGDEAKSPDSRTLCTHRESLPIVGTNEHVEQVLEEEEASIASLRLEDDSPNYRVDLAEEVDLDTDVQQSEPTAASAQTGDPEDVDMFEFKLDMGPFSSNIFSNTAETDAAANAPDEDFTETSLQLAIQRDIGVSSPAPTVEMEAIGENLEQQESTANDATADEMDTAEFDASSEENVDSADMVDYEEPQNNASSGDLLDIADGLILAPSLLMPADCPGRKLRSPSPPPRTESGLDDATATFYMDDDTAMLKDFLTRTAASKATKATTITRRSSLNHRRDSDAIRHALASPRKVLEDKDPNSPSKYDNDATLDLTLTLTLTADQQLPLSPTPEKVDVEDVEGPKGPKTSRRSTRERKSRLPAPSAAATQTLTPKTISVRRADGGEPIVLKKSDAQALGLLTRNNTRKNKQGAFHVSLRLMKLNTEFLAAAGREDASTKVEKAGKKNVRWDETLAYYQTATTTVASALAEAESLATPDELSVSVATPSSASKKKQPRERKEKSDETPRVRKVRGLGAGNGTPGKGLLTPASLLPEGVTKEKETLEKAQRLPKPTKPKRMVIAPSASDTDAEPVPKAPETQLPALGVAPIGIEPAKEAGVSKERKSRLATLRKGKLPAPVSRVSVLPNDGKENQQQIRSRIGSVTPRKGTKLPDAVVPPAVESGLPRRRAGARV